MTDRTLSMMTYEDWRHKPTQREIEYARAIQNVYPHTSVAVRDLSNAPNSFLDELFGGMLSVRQRPIFPLTAPLSPIRKRIP